jgi:hypothetical protein
MLIEGTLQTPAPKTNAALSAALATPAIPGASSSPCFLQSAGLYPVQPTKAGSNHSVLPILPERSSIAHHPSAQAHSVCCGPASASVAGERLFYCCVPGSQAQPANYPSQRDDQRQRYVFKMAMCNDRVLRARRLCGALGKGVLCWPAQRIPARSLLSTCSAG